ncbi:MAG TPA: tetratricopeptide repeat protein, partial [Phycisphaerae bacterium]
MRAVHFRMILRGFIPLILIATLPALASASDPEPQATASQPTRPPELTPEDKARVEELGKAIRSLRQQGKNSEAISSFEELLAIHRRVGESSLGLARALELYAESLLGCAEFERAERAARESLAIRLKLVGDEHLESARAYMVVGRVAAERGDYVQAEVCWRRTLTVRRNLLGQDHLDVARITDNLAGVLRAQGKFAEGEALCRDAVRVFQAQLGEHPDVAYALNNLGSFLVDKGDYAGAEKVLRESLDILRAVQGNEHPAVAAGLSNLAIVLQHRAQYAPAENAFREALAIRRRALGPDHPSVALTLSSLAVLLRTKGDLEGAEALAREAFEIERRRLGESHPQIGVTLNLLATLAQDRFDFPAAQALFEESLALRQRLLGEHPDVATTLQGLGKLAALRGDNSSAEGFFRQALDLYSRILGDSHSFVAECLRDLAATLERKPDEDSLKEAHRAYQRAIAIERQHEEPTLPNICARYARFLDRRCNRPEDSISLYQEAIERIDWLRVQISGDELDRSRYFTTLSSDEPFGGLARARLKMGARDEAPNSSESSAAGAFNAIESGRGRSLLDLLDRGPSDVFSLAQLRAERDTNQSFLMRV